MIEQRWQWTVPHSSKADGKKFHLRSIQATNKSGLQFKPDVFVIR
jgi:hypothetical protein